MFFNPFHEVFENKHYPHARTLRTGFWTKLKDSYSVLGGTIFAPTDKAHFGLFDYATFMLPALSFMAIEWSWKRLNNPLYLIPLVPSIALTVGLFIGRAIFAAVGTMLSAPIVGLVNMVSYLAAKPILKRANKIKVNNDNFSEYLYKKHLTIETVSADHRNGDVGCTEVSQPTQDVAKKLDSALTKGINLAKKIFGANTEAEDNQPTIFFQAFIPKDLYLGGRMPKEGPFDNPSIASCPGCDDVRHMSHHQEIAFNSKTKTNSDPDGIKALYELNVGELSTRYGLFNASSPNSPQHSINPSQHSLR